MKNFLSLILICAAFACSKPKLAEVQSLSTQDSTDIFLQLANNDSISLDKKIEFNDKAYAIVISKTNDSLNRVKLFKVANRYYNTNSFSKYRSTATKIIERATEDNDTASIAKAYVYLGDFYKEKGIKDSAFSYYVKAEKIYNYRRDKVNTASVKISEAEVLWNGGDYYAGESSAIEALKYLREVNEPQKKYEALVLLGIISNAVKEFDSALDYLNKALEVVENNELTSPSPLATTLNNIGNVYQSAGKNKEAISYFERALNDKNLERDNPLLYSVLLDNLAYSKFKVNDKGDVVGLFKKSIKLKDSLQYYSGISFSETRLAEYYFNQGDTNLAIDLTKNALSNAALSNNVINKLTPLKQLTSYDLPNSNKYSAQYIKINDSVQQSERKIKDKFARILFETDQIQDENGRLATQNRNLALFFIGTVMIGLLLFVIRMQRAKNRELMLKQAQQKANEDIYNLMLAQQNNIEQGRIKEKKRIAQELHDGVLSRLFGARLNLDSLNKVDGGEAIERRNNYLTELKNIEQDIREISHDLNREKFVLINNFIAILNNLLEEQSANFEAAVSVNIDENVPWDKVSNALKINIYRIVQESLQNVNKYAQAKHVSVSLQRQGTWLNLQISDDGLGFAVDRKSKGIGLQNMMSRAAECDGKFEIKSKKGKGTTIFISFPTENQTNPEQPVPDATPVIA